MRKSDLYIKPREGECVHFVGFFVENRRGDIMRRTSLFLSLVFAILFIGGCGKIRLGDAAALPGLGETFGEPPANAPAPQFKNGDIVHYKMIEHQRKTGREKYKRGIMMHCDYKYIPRLQAYYCIVDFYPSSAVHIDFSDFDNYERRYVYEFELQKEKKPVIPARWAWMANPVK